MSPRGDSDNLLVQARSALLDALEALSEHRDAVIVIGAQAIYLHTGNALVALAEATKDSDLALDPRRLDDDPLLEEAMTRAGFHLNTFSGQPGAWMNRAGIPVDLMVPEDLAGIGTKNTRGARNPRPTTRAPPVALEGWKRLSSTTPLWTSALWMGVTLAAIAPGSLAPRRSSWPRSTRSPSARTPRTGSTIRMPTTSTGSWSLSTLPRLPPL